VRGIMPKELEEKLKKQAVKKGLKGERKKAYIYGTMKRIEKEHAMQGGHKVEFA